MDTKDLRKALETFFKGVPPKEILSKDGPIPTVKGSPMHWKIADGNRHVRGSFLLGAPKPESAVEQEKFERAILVLEIELNAAINRYLASAARGK